MLNTIKTNARYIIVVLVYLLAVGLELGFVAKNHPVIAVIIFVVLTVATIAALLWMGFDFRTLLRLSWKILGIAIGIAIIAVCTIALPGLTNYVVDVSIDGTTATAYEDSDKALKQAVTITVNDETVITLADEATDLAKVNVSITPYTTDADTGELVAGNAISASTSTIGVSKLAYDEESMTFSFDANSVFAEGDLLLIQIDFNGSANKYGSEVSTRYYAVTVGATEVVDEPAIVDDESELESNGGLSAIISFNGFGIRTYQSMEEAIQNYYTLETALLTVKVIPGEAVSRVRICPYGTDGSDLLEEWFLYADTDWSTTMDISAYAGDMIVIAIKIESDDFAPVTEVYYFAVGISSDVASEVEEAASEAE